MIKFADRLLTGSPSLFASVGFLLYLLSSDHRAPASLTESLGATAAGFWVYGVIGSSGAVGLLCLLRPRVAIVRVETVLRIANATFLAGYAAALIGTDSQPWITIGLAVGAAAWNLVRWRQVVSFDLPTARAEAMLKRGVT